ncbi:MAG TPA: TIGR03943 family protein [Rectinemataceae bacterium]|nr:TIGR03943 family protein [Rectinemataceae bacterium]
MPRGAIGSRPLHSGPSIRRGLWLAALVGYAAYFAYLLLSGGLWNLVSPRMTVFVAIGFAILLLLIAVQLRRLVVGGPGAALKPGLFLFLVPFAFLPFALNDNPAVLAMNGGISLREGGPRIDLTTRLQKAVNPFLPAPKPPPSPPKGGAVPLTGPIVLDQSDYYAVYQELYDSPAAFAGRTIEASGFVYPEPGRRDFIVARELMWCCAADAVGIGFVTHPGASAPPEGSAWVSVRGILGTTTYADRGTGLSSIVPMIRVESMDRMKEPDFAFVYPK